MRKAKVNDPIIVKFRDAVQELYGSRVQRMVLYGSRARGDARPGSDYDVAVFLTDIPSLWDEVNRITDIAYKIYEDTGADIHPKLMLAGSWRDRTALMHEIRKDGLEL